MNEPESPQLPAPAEVATMVLATSEAQQHLSTMFRWGKIMAASGFFKDSREAAQACVKIQAGHELGFAPAASMRSIYVFDGQISLSYPAMASKVNQSPNYEYKIIEKSPEKVVLKWWGKSKRTGVWDELGTSEFSQADVVTAGLQNKEVHKKYPIAMKLARAMSMGCRMYCPELFNGSVFVPEEIGGNTVNVDAEGNVTGIVSTPNSKLDPPQNVTPITNARSASTTPPDSTPVDRRKDLLAQIRTISNIKKTSVTAAEMESIIADISITLGHTYKKITEVSDDALQTYVNRKKNKPDADPTEREIDAVTPEKMTARTNARLFALLNAIGVKSKAARLEFARNQDVDVNSFTELTEADATTLCGVADELQRAGVTAWAEPDAIAAQSPPTETEWERCNGCGARTAPAGSPEVDEPHASDCEVAFPSP
jgi:hypothetical protein